MIAIGLLLLAVLLALAGLMVFLGAIAFATWHAARIFKRNRAGTIYDREEILLAKSGVLTTQIS